LIPFKTAVGAMADPSDYKRQRIRTRARHRDISSRALLYFLID